MAEMSARIEQFRKMAEADPDNELGHLSLGRAYLEAGMNAEAIGALGRALALNPKLSRAYQDLAAAYLKLGQFRGCFTDFLNHNGNNALFTADFRYCERNSFAMLRQTQNDELTRHSIAGNSGGGNRIQRDLWRKLLLKQYLCQGAPSLTAYLPYAVSLRDLKPSLVRWRHNLEELDM
jgi:tetratricopeptide (TPR) repeat protein